MQDGNPAAARPRDIDWSRDLGPCPPLLDVTRRKIVIAAIATVITYLAGVTGRWFAMPDSAVYLELARSLAEGRGYVSNGAVHTRFAPGLPLALAGLRLLFGDGYWVANLFIALCGIAAAAVMYLAMREMTRDVQLAYATTLSTVFSYGFYSYSHRIMSDVPYALAFWLMLYATLRYAGGARKWLVIACVMSALGTVIRLPGILLAGSAALGLALDRDWAPLRRRLVAGGAIVAVAGAVCLGFYALTHSAAGTAPGYVHTVAAAANQMLPQMSQRVVNIPIALVLAITQSFAAQNGFWPLGIAVFALGVAGLISLWRGGKRLPVAVVVVYLGSLGVMLSMYGLTLRYCLPILPVMFYALFAGVIWACEAIGFLRARPYPRTVLRWAIAVTTAVSVATNVPRVLREAFYYSYLSHTPDYYGLIRPVTAGQFLTVADGVSQYCPPGTTVGAAAGEVPVISFMTGRRAIPIIPLEGRDRSKDFRIALNFVRTRQDVDFLVVSSGLGPQAFRRLRSILDVDASFQIVCQVPLIYRRVRTSEAPPAGRPGP